MASNQYSYKSIRGSRSRCRAGNVQPPRSGVLRSSHRYLGRFPRLSHSILSPHRHCDHFHIDDQLCAPADRFRILQYDLRVIGARGDSHRAIVQDYCVVFLWRLSASSFGFHPDRAPSDHDCHNRKHGSDHRDIHPVRSTGIGKEFPPLCLPHRFCRQPDPLLRLPPRRILVHHSRHFPRRHSNDPT